MLLHGVLTLKNDLVRVWPCSLDPDPKTLKKITIPKKTFAAKSRE